MNKQQEKRALGRVRITGVLGNLVYAEGVAPETDPHKLGCVTLRLGRNTPTDVQVGDEVAMYAEETGGE